MASNFDDLRSAWDTLPSAMQSALAATIRAAAGVAGNVDALRYSGRRPLQRRAIQRTIYHPMANEARKQRLIKPET